MSQSTYCQRISTKYASRKEGVGRTEIHDALRKQYAVMMKSLYYDFRNILRNFHHIHSGTRNNFQIARNRTIKQNCS